MDGRGSGEQWDAKSTTDAVLRLDVRWLVRHGLIVSQVVAEATLHGSATGTPISTIRARYDARHPDVVVHYQERQATAGAWRAVREVIGLERTPCHYGGERLWCRCPGCGARRAVLYTDHGRFQCVRCNDLAYSSTREDALARLNRRGERLLERLDAEPTWVLNWGLPPRKPKGMHWQTYARLWDEWARLFRAAHAAAEADVQKLLTDLHRSGILTPDDAGSERR